MASMNFYHFAEHHAGRTEQPGGPQCGPRATGCTCLDYMIKKCFAKAKFIEEEILTETDDAELLEIWEALPV